MRDFLEIPPNKEDDNLLAKPRSQPHERIKCEFASLAYRLGFESEEIRHQIQRSPDEEIARKALLKARDPNRYIYDDAAFANFVEQMVNFFSTAEKREDETIMDFESYPRVPKRSGIPQIGIYKADKLSLYLERLHSTCEDKSDEVTPFFVRRSVYFAFFGKPNRAKRERLERLIREEQRRLIEQNRQEQEQRRARVASDEQGRLDQERREEQERFEQERQKLEQERLEQERLEQERQILEQERIEQERQILEQERLEQERLEKVEQEKLEQKRPVRMEQKRNKKKEERGNQQTNPIRGREDKKQATSSPAAIQKNRKRTTRIDFNKLTDAMTQAAIPSRDSTADPQLERRTGQVQGDIGEQTIPTNDHQGLQAVTGAPLASTSQSDTAIQRTVDIHIKIKDHGKWIFLQTFSVDPSDTKELRRFVVQYMRKHEPIYQCTKDERIVKVSECFEAVIEDGENTLYLIPKWEMSNASDMNGNNSNGDNNNGIDSEVAPGASKIPKLS